jgi:DNA-binding PadR family transcriptional regulator
MSKLYMRAGRPRLSAPRLRVLARLMEPSGGELSGAEIMRETGLASGSLYPMLYAFEASGLVESRWETEEPQALGRPRRRLYRITTLGEQTTRDECAPLRALFPTSSEP